MLKIADRDNLDVLFIQEGRTIAKELKKQAADFGYELVGKVNRGAMVRDNLILTRLPSTKAHIANMGGIKWRRADRNAHKGKHPARRGMFARQAGINFFVIHGPPRPHKAGKWITRRNAMQAYYMRLDEFFTLWRKRDKYPYVGGGDFNRTIEQIKRHEVSFKGTVVGKGIDGFIAGPGVKVSNVEHRDLSGWFDHPLVMCTITVKA